MAHQIYSRIRKTHKSISRLCLEDDDNSCSLAEDAVGVQQGHIASRLSVEAFLGRILAERLVVQAELDASGLP